MMFVFTLKDTSEADMVIPALCNGPDHAKARARELMAKHPTRRIIEVAHRGKVVLRYEARPPEVAPQPTRPALEL